MLKIYGWVAHVIIVSAQVLSVLTLGLWTLGLRTRAWQLDLAWHSDTAFYTYYVGLHLNFSSLVPLVTRTRSVSNSLKVTPLLPPTKLNTCSVMVMGTHSPKTAAVKTFLLSVLLAEELSLNASWSLLFSESDTNKKCLTVLGCTNR